MVSLLFFFNRQHRYVPMTFATRYRQFRAFLVFATAFFGLTLSACEGPAGPPGEDGMDGVANIQVETFRVEASDFQSSSSSEVATRSMDMITQAVTSEGTVLAYTDVATSGSGWTAMPLTIPVQSTAVEYTFGYDVGEFRTIILREEGNSPVAEAFGDSRIKVVAIPPSEAAEAAKSYHSYEQAARELGLE
jgi:hypothetical protein